MPPPAILAVALLSVLATGTQERPLWGGLEAGPFAVGFTSRWEEDPARTYRFRPAVGEPAEPARPRPILVNVWYPAAPTADAERMTHGDYLDIVSDQPGLGNFTRALAAYQRSVMLEYAFGLEPGAIDAASNELLEELLATPTPCVRGAPAATGRFPLVLYHAGYGSSFEDNSVLCEFLASHGYVVVGSAFQKGDGLSFNVDGRDGSYRDLEFLIRSAARLPWVDTERVGLAGHSGGAHVTLEFGAQPFRNVHALVSLDTTQDYHGLDDPRWKRMVDAVLRGDEHVTEPILFAAEPHATFQLGDRLDGAERYYLTLRDLDHNTFTSQGVIHSDRTAGAALREAPAPAVRASYEGLCRIVRRFFDAHLKDDEKALDVLIDLDGAEEYGGAEPHLRIVPAGVTGPELFAADEEIPPTPRQLRGLLEGETMANVLAVLERFHAGFPDHPVYHASLAQALVDELVHADRVADARALHEWYQPLYPRLIDQYLALIRLYRRLHRPGYVDWFCETALALAPERAEEIDRLRSEEDRPDR